MRTKNSMVVFTTSNENLYATKFFEAMGKTKKRVKGSVLAIDGRFYHGKNLYRDAIKFMELIKRNEHPKILYHQKANSFHFKELYRKGLKQLIPS